MADTAATSEPDAERGPSGSSPANPPREGSAAEEPDDAGGPPEDAVTSYEDLPADLFGEPDDAPAAPPPRGEAADPSASRTPGASSAASRDANGGRPRPAGSPAPSDPAEADGAEAPEAETIGPGPAATGVGTARAEAAAADAGRIDRQSPLAMVQSLFPGRIVAIEPLAGGGDEAAEAEGADAASDRDEADANDPDDGPPPGSG